LWKNFVEKLHLRFVNPVHEHEGVDQEDVEQEAEVEEEEEEEKSVVDESPYVILKNFVPQNPKFIKNLKKKKN